MKRTYGYTQPLGRYRLRLTRGDFHGALFPLARHICDVLAPYIPAGVYARWTNWRRNRRHCTAQRAVDRFDPAAKHDRGDAV